MGPAPHALQVKDPEVLAKIPFLVDHWPYCLDELVWLLELCFNFKASSASYLIQEDRLEKQIFGLKAPFELPVFCIIKNVSIS